jgi:hypothetical protein
MEIPAPCPSCGAQVVWEVDWRFAEETAWSEGNAPTFGFRCLECHSVVHIAFLWRVERGAAPRPLRLVVPSESGRAPEPLGLLVARCPHGCGLKLGFQLEPEDRWNRGSLRPGSELVIGGHRCPRCDGEGRVVLAPQISRAQSGK